MISIFNKFKLLNNEMSVINSSDNIGFNTLVYELKIFELEVKDLRIELQRMTDELKHKQLVLENLWGSFGVQSQSMSETSFSDSDQEANVEVAKLQAGSGEDLTSC